MNVIKEIISPVSKQDLLSELTEERFVRKTNKGGNEIYCFTAQDSPNLMREVGRLREITFRKAGGGTGKELDIDDFDTDENPYHQLIVWDPKAKEILGGYRFILCKNASSDQDGKPKLATTNLFQFSDNLNQNYLPYMIELGRSFVQPEYQSIKKGRKSLYALDNLWDGLGALVIEYPEIKYFFGKVTMYPHFNRDARNHILHFMNTMFPDNDKLAYPTDPLPIEDDFVGPEYKIGIENFKENYKKFSQLVRGLGENVPPLINAYMSLSSTMRCFGTAINRRFGDVEETGIMITIADINDSKKERHIKTYSSFLKLHLPKSKSRLRLFSKKK
ncbi:MAG: GNAT family N-acetyltransferase [Marinifilaceae bacterium]|jgi:hypothetical protein|nr:GNAT family N-acetyltransferase [Marinifilaceae bacterium]